jgi:hypothetical protein
MVNITTVSEEAAISDNAEGSIKFPRNSRNFNNLNTVRYPENSPKKVILLFRVTQFMDETIGKLGVCAVI